MKIDRKRVYDKYEGHCAYCGNMIMFKEMQVDHMHPKRLSNLYEYCQKYIDGRPGNINEMDNLMPSCRTCNHYKRALDIEGFRRQMLTLLGRVEQIYIYKVAVKYGICKSKAWDGIFYFEKSRNGVSSLKVS